MELSTADSFLRAVSRWPVTDAEINSAAEKALAFLGGTMVGISAAWPEARVGVSYATGNGNGNGGGDISQMELCRDFARRMIEQVSAHPDSAGDRIRHLQVASGGTGAPSTPSSPHAPTRHVSVVPIAIDLRTQPGVREGKRRQLFGWVVACSERAPGVKEELGLMLVAHRLGELASVAYFETQLQEGSQFLSIASHELKTPLTAIYGVLQLQERMLKMGQGGPGAVAPQAADSPKPAMHSYLRMTIRQVERLNELIDGLLDMSRIQNGRFRVEPMEADVAAILQEVVRGRLSVIAQEAGVKIQVDAPETLRARVDSVRMEEVLTNLVMNAIRFSPEGGVVNVKMREEEGAFRVMVRDQGPPIPLEDRERIFRPFERAQRTSRLGGLGLGLFISRQIAQLHGGNVTLVESVAGKGNLFEAYFPNRALSQSISA